MMKTLVIGASTNPMRYSFLAINKLLSYKHEVVAFGLKKGYVNEVEIQTEQIPFEDIDTVTLYLNPTNQLPYYDYILSLKPKRVIFNPGTENPELVEILKNHQIKAEIACTLVLLSTNQF